jgi:cell division protein FtsZ
LRTKPSFKEEEEEKENTREFVFTPENKTEKQNFDFAEEEDDDFGDESLFGMEDEFDTKQNEFGDQVINDEGMMELRTTKERLRQQAELRKAKLKEAKKPEMTKEEFSEKWTLPAYLRRGMKMQDVPHSSEPFISKYNLNDDNNILGNNKFLHDNVD